MLTGFVLRSSYGVAARDVVGVRRPCLLRCSALPNHHGRFHNSGCHGWDVGRTALHWLAWRLNHVPDRQPFLWALFGSCTLGHALSMDFGRCCHAGYIAGFPNTYAEKVGKTSDGMYKGMA